MGEGLSNKEIARQLGELPLVRREKFPARGVDPESAREIAHRLGRIGGQIETDGQYPETVGADHALRLADCLREKLGRRRAYRSAAGVDEAHQQRLATVVGQPHLAPMAVDEREVRKCATDRGLAQFQRRIRVESYNFV